MFQRFNQLKVHPFQKFWFSDVFNQHPCIEGEIERQLNDPYATEAEYWTAVLRRIQSAKARAKVGRCKLDPSLKAPPGCQSLIVKKG